MVRMVTTELGGILVIDGLHPSLDGELARFFDELHDEPRYFGPSASTNPKPFRSLVEALRRRDGLRLAALECGRVVGVARVDGRGELFIAVTADRRGAGIGSTLGHAAVQRAACLGHRRVVLRTSRRSGAARRVGEHLGGTVVERGRGRTEFVVESHAYQAARPSP
jgi:GNAT superfamily N-acetyltransferase